MAGALGRGLLSSLRQAASIAERPGDLSALDRREPYDVCVIGTGPAGAIVANDLVERGFRVVLLESGATAGRFDVSGLDVYRNAGAVDYPLAASRTRALGGTTDKWTGRCLRLRPLDFEAHAYTPAGSGWPFGYEDLEPYFTRAERTLRVRGGEPAPLAAPRAQGYPLPEEQDAGGLRQLLRRAGIEIESTPKSTGLRGPGPLRVARDLLPSFRASATGTLVCGATVVRLRVGAGGVVDGAEVRNLDGEQGTARARFYALAAGGIETPRLLLLSPSPTSPRGIGNRRDRVGRGFTDHPSYRFHGRVRHTWRTVWPLYELAYSPQFCDSFKRRGLGTIDLGFIRSWVFPDDVAELRAGRGGEALGAILGRASAAELLISALIELRPADHNRVTLEPDLVDRFGSPAAKLSFSLGADDERTLGETRALVARIFADLGASAVAERPLVWAHHHTGTCAAGDDPATSVVDADLRVHESPNLFLVGSSVFVTAGAANPTLTIAALAHRLADHLTARLRSE